MSDQKPRDAGEERPVQWREGNYTVTRSTAWSAPGCHDGCGVLFYTDDSGTLVKVEGDPENPYNQGALCMRCLNLPEAVNSPYRLKYPMKRDPSKRGQDAWERISWDEAMDTIEEKVHYYQENFGVESIVAFSGTGRETWWCTSWYVYTAFRTPNMSDGFLTGESCYNPRMSQMGLMIGDMCVADCAQFHELRYDEPTWEVPKCMLIWGNNPIASNADGFFGHWVVECMKRGTELVVVDPGMIWLAAKAKYWLPIRPGTDAALAMCFLNVAIEEDLLDHDFIDRWCWGFDEIAERVSEWTPEKAAEVCWLDADKIRAAARFYATSHPAAIQWGVAVDQSYSGVCAAQALTALWAVTGNMDVPGGNVIARGAYNTNLFGEAALHCVDPEVKKRRIGDNAYPFRGAGLVSDSALGDEIIKTLETGEPYPLKMAWLGGTNPIANMGAEAPRLRRGLLNTEFCVAVDYIMTPTIMAVADMVLPVSMNSERDSLRAWWYPMRAINKATTFYEAKSDEEIGIMLMNRLNPEQSPGKDIYEWYDFALKDGPGNYADFDWETLRKYTALWPKYEYRKYETGKIRFDGQPGFNTASGRFELYIPIMSQFDLDPLPWYEDPHEGPISTPELFEEYPFVLTTGARSYEFFHSEHRFLPTMREFHPWPTVEINYDVCKKMGLEEDDWVYVENHRGSCKLRVRPCKGLNRRVVRAEHGWWFPEQEGAEPHLFGTFDSNINNLIPQGDVGPSGYGAPIKCGICRIRKCSPSEVADSLTSKVITEGVF